MCITTCIYQNWCTELASQKVNEDLLIYVSLIISFNIWRYLNIKSSVCVSLSFETRQPVLFYHRDSMDWILYCLTIWGIEKTSVTLHFLSHLLNGCLYLANVLACRSLHQFVRSFSVVVIGRGGVTWPFLFAPRPPASPTLWDFLDCTVPLRYCQPVLCTLFRVPCNNINVYETLHSANK